MKASEVGGSEVALPVLASTLTTVVVFFPVLFLYGVSRFLFSSLALAVVLSLFASYAVAMTIMPLFCSRLIRVQHDRGRLNAWFNRQFTRMLDAYERSIDFALRRPSLVVAGLLAVFMVSLGLYPLLGVAFFPRTDAAQFVINVKAPSGTRLSVTEAEVRRVENIIHETVRPEDLGLIVSNIGVTPDFSSIYTSNSAQHTAFVQASLKEDHKIGSYEYMRQVRERIARELPELNAYFQSAGPVDAVLNMGLPAPIDIQVSGSNLSADYKIAAELASKIRAIRGVSDVLIPQDLDYPALQIDVDRKRAGELGLTQREVVQNLITAFTSNQMIAPSYWVDPKTGNDYLLTVQYPEGRVRNFEDLQQIPLRSPDQIIPTELDAVSTVRRIQAPTEVDHYQLRKLIDIYVGLSGEDLGHVATAVDGLIKQISLPEGVRIDVRGMVQGMRASFRSFAIGLCLAVVLLYFILVAQFESFLDPVLILLAVPPGLTGVLLTLWLTGTTLNVQSLMGVVMMVGIVVSNSILIVDFAHRLRRSGMPVRKAVVTSCRVRLRPVLMTSLATIIGLIPMALQLGTGSEAYAPLARAIIGGLTFSVVLTVYLVPAAYLRLYEKKVFQEAQ